MPTPTFDSSIIAVPKHTRLTTESLSELLATRGIRLLSSYAGSQEKVLISCYTEACPNTQNVFFDALRSNKIMTVSCDNCRASILRAYNASIGQTIEIDALRKRCAVLGLTLLTENYTNSTTHLYLRCSEGHTCTFTAAQIMRGDRCRCRQCHQIYPQGADHHWYNPALTKEERARGQNQASSTSWRKKVFARDGKICQLRGDPSEPVTAHHLLGRTEYAQFARDPANGVTLTVKYHKEFHARYGSFTHAHTVFEFMEFFREKTGHDLIVANYLLEAARTGDKKRIVPLAIKPRKPMPRVRKPSTVAPEQEGKGGLARDRGRFPTRADLCAYVWDRFVDDRWRLIDIATAAEVGEWTVTRILRSGEGSGIGDTPQPRCRRRAKGRFATREELCAYVWEAVGKGTPIANIAKDVQVAHNTVGTLIASADGRPRLLNRQSEGEPHDG